MDKQLEDLVKETERLIDDCQRLRRQLAISYQWKPETETAPEGWHQEADQKGLWKMFRGSRD